MDTGSQSDPFIIMNKEPQSFRVWIAIPFSAGAAIVGYIIVR